MLLTFLSTVLITGASRGIGRATAKAFADSGWDLLLLARSEEALERIVEEIDNKKFDLIISDMSPNKTGNKVSDQYKFYNIADSILEFSQNGLMSKGMMVMKVFIGHGFEEFKSDLRENFETVIYFKPKSSRKESRETYVIAKNIRYN